MRVRIVPAAVGIAFLGIIGGTQSADPNINATALLRAAKSLDLGNLTPLAASIASLVLAGTVIATGTVADRVGRKKVLSAGLVAVAAGDVLVILASGSAMFMLGRVIVGLGMGAVFGSVFAYVKHFATGKGGLLAAVGILMAAGFLTNVIVTFVGGLLAGIDWRVAYMLIPVVSLIVLVVGQFIVPGDDTAERLKGGWDLPGQAMMSLGIIALLVGVAHISAGLGSPLTWVPLVAGAVLLIGFVIWERHRAERAFFPAALFRSPIFIAAILIGLTCHLAYGAGLLSFTSLFQITVGLRGSALALAQLPFLLAGIVTAFVFTKVRGDSGRRGRGAMVIGTITTALGFAALAVPAWGGSDSYWSYVAGTILIGAGAMLASIPFGSMILESADATHLGPVSASRFSIGQFWMALGLAGSTVIIDGLARHDVQTQLGTRAAVDFETWAVSGGRVPEPARVLDVAGAVYPGAFAWAMIIVAVLVGAAGAAAVTVVARWDRTQAASGATGSEA